MIPSDKTDSMVKFALEFNAKQADQILSKTIDERINELKLNKLSMWVRDHSCDCSKIDNEIKALERQKIQLNQLSERAKNRNINLYLEEQK